MHGIDDVFVLPHAQIVVRAPDRDFTLAILKPRDGLRKLSALPLQVDENAIATFTVNFAEGVFECFEVFHGNRSPLDKNWHLDNPATAV